MWKSLFRALQKKKSPRANATEEIPNSCCQEFGKLPDHQENQEPPGIRSGNYLLREVRALPGELS
jgi:hypothetical protein